MGSGGVLLSLVARPLCVLKVATPSKALAAGPEARSAPRLAAGSGSGLLRELVLNNPGDLESGVGSLDLLALFEVAPRSTSGRCCFGLSAAVGGAEVDTEGGFAGDLTGLEGDFLGALLADLPDAGELGGNLTFAGSLDSESCLSGVAGDMEASAARTASGDATACVCCAFESFAFLTLPLSLSLSFFFFFFFLAGAGAASSVLMFALFSVLLAGPAVAFFCFFPTFAAASDLPFVSIRVAPG